MARKRAGGGVWRMGNWGRIGLVCGVLCGAPGLGGCQDSGLDLSARSATKIVVGPTVPVSLASVEGLSAEASPRFSAALATEAQAREIVFVDAERAPRFRLKGYLDAYQGENGTTLAWVWDVYDTRARRAQRVSGTQNLNRSGADPWSAVDDRALRFVAARSLDDIAVFLAANRTGDALVAAGPAPAKEAASATVALAQ